MVVAEGEEAVLHCDVNDKTDMLITWYMDNKMITNTERRYQDGTDLVIRRVSLKLDSGVFYCEAQHTTSGMGIQSTTAMLNVTWISDGAKTSLRKPKDGNITLQDEVSLKCEVDGSPTPRITWYKNKVRLYDEPDNEYRISEARLKILSISAEYNGIYTCEGENAAGVAKSGESYLVNVKDSNAAFLKDGLFQKTIVTVRDENIWMHCEFENVREINWYRWTTTSYLMVNSTRARTTIYGNGTVQISSVRKSDEGTYLCQGMGFNDEPQSFTTELLIAKLPKFTRSNLEPRLENPIILAKDSSFEIDCQKADGIPAPTISWLNSAGEAIVPGVKLSVSGNKLIFNPVDVSHNANYTCVAENMAGKREITVEIIVTVPPIITQMPTDTEIKEGQTGQLQCGYNGSAPPWTQVIWYKDSKPLNKEVFERQELTLDQQSGKLAFQFAKPSMEGAYSCVVNTSQQEAVESQTINLNIIEKLKFYPQPRSMSFELGTTGSVPCRAKAERTPNIEWRHFPDQVTLPDGVFSEDGMLKFYNIQKEMAGAYTCVVTTTDPILNTPETLEATITVTVGVSPTITYQPQNQSVKEGDNVMMNCEAVGDPTPNIKWVKEGTLLSLNSSLHYQQLENNSLIILSANLSDEATYGCLVGNFMGFKRAEMKLRVISNSTIPGNVNELAESDQKISITKTIVIAVCSSVAYLSLVIGLVVFCSIRLMKKKQKAKLEKKAHLTLHNNEQENPGETDCLMADRPANGLSNRNAYVMHEQYQTITDSHMLKEGSKGTQSPRSCKSNESTQSTSGNTDIMKYDLNQLQNIGVLGNGIYGDVFLAKSSRDEDLVCIKRLLNREENVQMEFRAEVEMFRKLNHERICRLLAICKETEPIYMVMEYCEWGDLKQFLLATSGSNSNSQELTIEPPDAAQKLSMCHQVASAMSHLSACRFVHKDLASRNILLEPNLNVKVASLSLSRDIYASEYVQVTSGFLLPLRWTSPEAWIEQDFSTKSDIWSFGCFLYEVFTGAEIPYPDKTNEQVIAGYSSGDIEPSAGNNMPSQLQTIAYQCWSSSPKDRPDFSQVVTMFSSIRMDSQV
ncbi:inactive tyrosine-protein kinase 7-like [Watersipora subatra]|uniref:inactive tyrosine-protein kinase 7-like n=1 Tax=Watersipora subatra TaxID=2589382 RepID=UPI00355B63E4